MGESNSINKGRRIQDLSQKHAILTSHKFCPYTHSQGLTWQECQAKEEAPHLGASLSNFEDSSIQIYMDESPQIWCGRRRRI